MSICAMPVLLASAASSSGVRPPASTAFGSAPRSSSVVERRRLILDDGKVQRAAVSIDLVHRPLDGGRVLAARARGSLSTSPTATAE